MLLLLLNTGVSDCALSRNKVIYESLTAIPIIRRKKTYLGNYVISAILRLINGKKYEIEDAHKQAFA